MNGKNSEVSKSNYNLRINSKRNYKSSPPESSSSGDYVPLKFNCFENEVSVKMRRIENDDIDPDEINNAPEVVSMNQRDTSISPEIQNEQVSSPTSTPNRAQGPNATNFDQMTPNASKLVVSQQETTIQSLEVTNLFALSYKSIF